jgi:hypothetical protein
LPPLGSRIVAAISSRPIRRSWQGGGVEPLPDLPPKVPETLPELERVLQLLNAVCQAGKIKDKHRIELEDLVPRDAAAGGALAKAPRGDPPRPGGRAEEQSRGVAVEVLAVQWLAHKSGSHSRGAGLIGDDVPLEANHRQPLLEPVEASESQSESSEGPVGAQ